ncbi:MAG TPA: DUF1223 domain-containing protein [Candidatus Sulfotelmatobacter sp.]|jgi:hypothetical protein|nr:DUF1223 domain-containing protein [Candidatus Sulfotelmatobacter sp.]
MKHPSTAAIKLSCGLFVVCFCLPFTTKPNAQTPATESGRRPVVVELFTSEGCSSCPPADALLQQLDQQQPVAGAEIIALEEHVDYWNHEGWNDPFSSAEWTLRQQDYAAVFKNDVYTPELVVNGHSPFVGNNARKAESEIERAAHGVQTEVAISPGSPQAKGAQRFTVSVGKLAQSTAGDVAEVWLAVTEDGLHSSVSLGENAGHVLHHIATLRLLQKIGVANANGASGSFAGEPVVKFKSHWDLQNLHVVVFVQEKKSRGILGAASTKIKS